MRINKHTSHPSAFISSTFIDLKAERLAVAKILEEAGLNINALDIKPASNSTSAKEIIKGIKESDFVILIVGHRYGAIIPNMTKSQTQSITKWEYLKAAKNFKKPVLVFFKDCPEPDISLLDNPADSKYKLKLSELKKFKAQLSNEHNPKYFSTPSDLAKEVKSALIPVYREGVRSLLEKQSNIEIENEHFKFQISNFRTSKEITLTKRS